MRARTKGQVAWRRWEIDDECPEEETRTAVTWPYRDSTVCGSSFSMLFDRSYQWLLWEAHSLRLNKWELSWGTAEYGDEPPSEQLLDIASWAAEGTLEHKLFREHDLVGWKGRKLPNMVGYVAFLEWARDTRFKTVPPNDLRALWLVEGVIRWNSKREIPTYAEMPKAVDLMCDLCGGRWEWDFSAKLKTWMRNHLPKAEYDRLISVLTTVA